MYIGRILLSRIAASLLVFLALTVVLFAAIETLPGDFATASAPRFTTEDQVERTREVTGLNAAPVERYISWLANAAQGDFGTSWYTRNPIAPLLAERLGYTALLAALATTLAIPLGFGLGLIAAIYRYSMFDRVLSALAISTIALPEFLSAYALMAISVSYTHLTLPTTPYV